MPKETKPSLAIWIGGFLITAALIAAALCSLLLLSHGEMSPNCQIEHGRSDSDVGTPCSNRAVATCADCRMWCCGESFCQWCGDYHRAHSCFRKSVYNEQQVFSRKAG